MKYYFFLLFFVYQVSFLCGSFSSIELISTPTTIGADFDQGPAQLTKVGHFKAVVADITMARPSSGKNCLDWHSFFVMKGLLDLNGQMLVLHNDLVFAHAGALCSLGIIHGHDYALFLSPRAFYFPDYRTRSLDTAVIKGSFSNVRLVLQSDITLTSSITIAENSIIEGFGSLKTLIIPEGCRIVIADGKVLQCNNVNLVVQGAFDSETGKNTLDSIQCAGGSDSSSLLQISNNAKLVFKGDVFVPQGGKILIDATGGGIQGNVTFENKAHTLQDDRQSVSVQNVDGNVHATITASGALHTTQAFAGTTQLSFDARNASQTIQASSDFANPTKVIFDNGAMIAATGKGKIEIVLPAASEHGYVQFVFKGTSETQDTTGLIIDEQNECIIPKGVTVTTSGIGTVEVRKGGNIQVDGVFRCGSYETQENDAVAFIVADTGNITISKTGRMSLAYGKNQIIVQGSGHWDSTDGSTEINMDHGNPTEATLLKFIVDTGKISGEFRMHENAHQDLTDFVLRSADIGGKPVIKAFGIALALTNGHVVMKSTLLHFLQSDATIDPADPLGLEHLTPGLTVPNLLVKQGTFIALPSAQAHILGIDRDAAGSIRSYSVYEPTQGTINLT